MTSANCHQGYQVVNIVGSRGYQRLLLTVLPQLSATVASIGRVDIHKTSALLCVTCDWLLLSAAMVKPEAGPDNGKYYTHDDWNTESTLETGAYRYSKVSGRFCVWRRTRMQALCIYLMHGIGYSSLAA